MRWIFITKSSLKNPPWFTLQHSDSIFTAMQGDPDITHNALRQKASSPHPFRQSSHIAGVAKDGGGERDAEE